MMMRCSKTLSQRAAELAEGERSALLNRIAQSVFPVRVTQLDEVLTTPKSPDKSTEPAAEPVTDSRVECVVPVAKGGLASDRATAGERDS